LPFVLSDKHSCVSLLVVFCGGVDAQHEWCCW